MKKNFDYPTQVIWYDMTDTKQMGIAYNDFVICACCGSVIPISEIYEDSEREEPIEEIEYWVDFREYIE